MVLSLTSFMHILNEQDRLDTNICATNGITKDEFGRVLMPERNLALLIECAEMINETRAFKYWSKRRAPRNPEALLEEAIDVLHFLASLTIQEVGLGRTRIERFYDYAGLDRENLQDMNTSRTGLFLELLQGHHLTKRFAAWSLILEGYGFTETDVIKMYDIKNAVNHQRQEAGY